MGAGRCATALSTRSDGLELPPSSDGEEVAPLPLLEGEADAPAWRVVELFSRTGLPFDAALRWSGGGGAGASARLTVPRSARVAVHARSLHVSASNLAPSVNAVGVTVADGFAVTRNRWERRVRQRVGEVTRVPVPPFAVHARVDLGDPDLLPLAVLQLIDPFGAPRAAERLHRLPPDGLPVGGAEHVELRSTADADLDLRVIFTLSL